MTARDYLHLTPAATALLALTVAVSLLGLFAVPRLVERGTFRPWQFTARREHLTVVTSAFLHADLAHLAFNAFTFWAFAFGLEARIGSQRFLALYAFGIVASAAGTWLQHRQEPGYRTLGASGAILAVLFASIVYFPRASLYILPLPVPIPAPLFALGYLAFTWYAARQARGRVNHDAHFSGAIAGLVFVLVTDAPAFGAALQSLLR